MTGACLAFIIGDKDSGESKIKGQIKRRQEVFGVVAEVDGQGVQVASGVESQGQIEVTTGLYF